MRYEQAIWFKISNVRDLDML